MKRIILFICLCSLVLSVMFLLKRKNHRSESIISSTGAMVSVKNPEFLSKDSQIGKKYFDENCVLCHGKLAGGIGGLGPPLVHKIYEPSHHGDIAFYMAVKNGVRSHHWNFGNMPAIKTLEREKVTKIIKYIRELQRNNGIR